MAKRLRKFGRSTKGNNVFRRLNAYLCATYYSIKTQEPLFL